MGKLCESFFKSDRHITEKSSYRASKKSPWACQVGVSLRQKLLPACHTHREMCDSSMYCVHRGHLIKTYDGSEVTPSSQKRKPQCYVFQSSERGS